MKKTLLSFFLFTCAFSYIKEGEAQDFDDLYQSENLSSLVKSSPQIDLPSPNASRHDKNSVKALKDNEPFLALDLNMPYFKGNTPELTNRNVLIFLKELKLDYLKYQDNECIRGVELKLPEKENRLFERIAKFLRKRNISKKLNSLENVKYVSAKTRKGETYWSIMFEKPVYKNQLEKIFSSINEEFTLDYYQNPAMKGIWVRVDLQGIEDKQAVATKLKQDFPNRIYKASICVLHTTMSTSDDSP